METAPLFGPIVRRNDALVAMSNETTAATASRAIALSQAAQRQVRMFALLILVAFVLSVLLAITIGRFVARSLRRLEVRATDLVNGRASTTPLPVRCPRELSIMATALNQLVTEYELLGAQAAALADGKAHDVSFTEVPKGLLGRTVHDAIRKLAHSVDENERTRLTLQHEATHDTLTGVLNRAGILEHLQGTLRLDITSSLIFIDLDRFKQVNDTYGHSVGDDILRAAAERLKDLVCFGDVVGRLGGDEFVFVTSGTVSDHRPKMLAQKIVDDLAVPFPVERGFVAIGASAGIARSAPSDNASSLLARADGSLYRAKAAGRGRVGDVVAVSVGN